MAAPAALVAAPVMAGKLAYDKLQEHRSNKQYDQLASDELESHITNLDTDTIRGGTIHARIVESGVTTTRISSFTVEVPGTGEDISLEEAVRRGLVSEETAQQYKESVTTDKSVESLVVLIIDPATGEEIVADEAIKRGIVTADEVNEFIQMKEDKNRLSNYGSMSSVNTGREGSHSRSQSRTDSRAQSRASSRSRLVPQSSPSETSRESSVGSSVEIGSTKESQYSSTLTVDVNRQSSNNYHQSETSSQSIETKIVNLKQGFALSSLDEVRNLQTGESMSIYEAKLRGIATDVQSSDKTITNNASAKVKEEVLMSKQTTITITDAVSRNLIDFSSGTFTNPANGQKISIAQAVSIGLLITDFKETVDESFIDIDANNVSAVDAFVHLFNDEQKLFERKAGSTNADGSITTTTRTYTLQQAVDQNWINGDDIILDIQSSDQLTLRQALDIKRVDGVTCEFTISETNEKLFLGDAARQGKVAIIPESVMTNSKPKMRPNYLGRKYALREAVDEGIYQHDTGLFFYQVTEEHITIYEAITIGLIDAKSAEIKNTSTEAFNNLNQAMNSKILDKKTCRVKDMELNVEYSVTDAYEKGLLRDVKKDSSASTPSNFESVNFWDAIDDHHLDTHTGLFTSIHEEGKKLRLEEAVFRKYIDKKSAYVIDSWKRKHCSLSEATRKNMIKEGMVMNTTLGKFMTIQEAIDANIIIREIKHLSIIDALDFGLYQPYSGRILVPGTEKDISLTEAMDMKIIDHKKTIIKNQRLGRYISTLEAMRLDDIDGHTGMYGSMNLLEARSRGFILPADAMVSSGGGLTILTLNPPSPNACIYRFNPLHPVIVLLVFNPLFIWFGLHLK